MLYFVINESISFSITLTVGVNLHQNEIKIITLKKKTAVEYFYNTTSQWTFVVLQTHSQYRNTSLSTQYNQESYTRSSTAIFKSISYNNLGEKTGRLGYIVQPSQGSTFKSLIAAVTYTGKCKYCMYLLILSFVNI